MKYVRIRYGDSLPCLGRLFASCMEVFFDYFPTHSSSSKTWTLCLFRNNKALLAFCTIVQARAKETDIATVRFPFSELRPTRQVRPLKTLFDSFSRNSTLFEHVVAWQNYVWYCDGSERCVSL